MAVRRKTPNVERVELGHVRLWLDDLEKIESIISRECAEGILVETDESTLDTVSDLRDFEESRIEGLTITGFPSPFPSGQDWRYEDWRKHGQFISLKLSSNLATIEVTNPESRHLGMIQLIVGICKSRQRWSFKSGLGAPAIVVTITSTIVGIVAALIFAEERPLRLWFVVGTVLLVTLFSTPALVKARLEMSSYSSATIFTRTRKEAPTFWERNSDQIVINSAFLLLGSLIGVLTTLWFT